MILVSFKINLTMITNDDVIFDEDDEDKFSYFKFKFSENLKLAYGKKIVVVTQLVLSKDIQYND